MKAKERIIVALDVDQVEKALSLVAALTPQVGCFKIGLEFTHAILTGLISPHVKTKEAIANLRKVRKLFAALNGRVFWDGKFDDIPNTVAGASKAVAALRIKAFNVHASAGEEAIRAAVANRGAAAVYGVTVLTSIDNLECISTFGSTPDNKVRQFAARLANVGAQGIICSPKELAFLAAHKGFAGLLKVTPGVRPTWASAGDQKRVMTPREAILAGADYLVIGRPITSPPEEIGSPVEAAGRIADEIAEALEARNGESI